MTTAWKCPPGLPQRIWDEELAMRRRRKPEIFTMSEHSCRCACSFSHPVYRDTKGSKRCVNCNCIVV